jgi:hypothetical protein
MKITVKVDNIEISIEEQGSEKDHVRIRYSDQNKQIQDTIKVMAEECVKLKSISNK